MEENVQKSTTETESASLKIIGKNEEKTKERLTKCLDKIVPIFLQQGVENYFRINGEQMGEFNIYLDMFISELFENTNLEQIMNKLRVGIILRERDFPGQPPQGIIYSALKKIEKKEDATFDKFADCLKKVVIETEEKEMDERTLYSVVLIQLKLSGEEKTRLCEYVRNVFELEIVPKEELQQILNDAGNYEKLSNCLTDEKLILKFRKNCRDPKYIIERLWPQLQQFFDFILFDEAYGKSPYQLIPGNNEALLRRVDIEFGIGLVNGAIEAPDVVAQQNERVSESLEGRNLYVIHNQKEGNYNQIIKYFETLEKLGKGSRKKVIEAIVKYGQACVETDRKLSFLLYWITVEQLFKVHGIRDYKDIESTICGLLKGVEMEYRVHKMCEKRNKFVHDYDTQITQSDRNFMKSIAENIIDQYVILSQEFPDSNDLTHALKMTPEPTTQLKGIQTVSKKLIEARERAIAKQPPHNN